MKIEFRNWWGEGFFCLFTCQYNWECFLESHKRFLEVGLFNFGVVLYLNKGEED